MWILGFSNFNSGSRVIRKLQVNIKVWIIGRVVCVCTERCDVLRPKVALDVLQLLQYHGTVVCLGGV